MSRLVVLGASNLTRGFHTVVATARAEWGPHVEVVAALGHGRSYGSESRVLVRTLPGILQSDLWPQLARMQPAATRAVVSDVGNDILYGFSHTEIVAWVTETVDRLSQFSGDIVLSSLPRVDSNEISTAKFLFFRSVLYPRCRLSLSEVSNTAQRVNEGLASLAATRGVRFVQLKREWYGVDPIHIRPSRWSEAWQEIICGNAAPALDGLSRVEGMRLYVMRPQRQRLCGVEFGAEQRGLCLRSGGKVWLY